MTNRSAGFTLVELLVASALFMALLVAFTGFLSRSRDAERIREGRTGVLMDQEAVAQLLRYELSLAGYGGLGADTLLDPSQPTLTIDLNGSSHAVSVRYAEDQFVLDAAEVRTVTLWVDPDMGALMRSVDGGDANAMATGVEALVVEGYLRRDYGVAPVIDPLVCGGICPPPEFVAGLELRLDFSDGNDMALTVGLYNAQRLRVLP